jgi:DNA (cytosine-5)-methyltransferase 1
VRAYYNEFDRHAAQWLRNLIAAGHIPDGDVDERSIRDVTPGDLSGYVQCHFFAGIGGWSLALALAGWSPARPVWTGSCPCQPFSAAGKRKGVADDRHLWPEFRRLIEARKPATVFGEQVASNAGRDWLAGVRVDVEALAYEFGAADISAAGVGAPHIRQRLFWVADANGGDASATRVQRGGEHGFFAPGRGLGERVADASLGRRGSVGREGVAGRGGYFDGGRAHGGGVADTEGAKRSGIGAEPHGEQGGFADGSAWGDAELIECSDGKARRIKPGLEPLVNGLSGRVGLLRAYGNAIVPQVAAAFIVATGLTEAAAGLSTNAESVKRGIGPVCAEKYGWGA